MPEAETLPDHWQLGCSNAKRWVNCPGSKYARDDRPAGTAALVGTLGHKILEQLAEGELIDLDDDDQALLDGMLPETKEWFFNSISNAMEFVDGLVAKADDARFELKTKSARIPDHGGTCDVVLWFAAERLLWVVDFKFGRNPVDAEENFQLAAYLNLARQEFPEAETFRATIYQPAYKGEDTVDVDAAWLDEWLIKAAVAADPENESRKAGDWCEYCPLLSSCKEAGRMIVQKREQMKKLLTPVGTAWEEAPKPLTEDELREIEECLVAFKIGSKAEKEAADILKAAAADGYPLQLFRVTTTSVRSWKPEAQSAPELEAFKECVLSTPAQVQKKLKINKEWFDERFGSMVEYTDRTTLRSGPKVDHEAVVEDFFSPISKG
jgi:hypothetical protein